MPRGARLHLATCGASLFMLGTILVCVGFAFLGLPRRRWVGAAGALLQGSGAWLFGMAARRRRRWIRTHAYFICIDCGYPLTGLAEVGRCPECGSHYTAAEVCDYWRRSAGARRPQGQPAEAAVKEQPRGSRSGG